MDQNKQIEEMAKDLQKCEHWYYDKHKTATNLYNEGYRKQSEIASKIFADIEEFRAKGDYSEFYVLLSSSVEKLKKKYGVTDTNVGSKDEEGK